MKSFFYVLFMTAGAVGFFGSANSANADKALYFHRSDTTISQKHADAKQCADLTFKKMPNSDGTENLFISTAIKCMRDKGYGFGFFLVCESNTVPKSLLPILRDKSRPPRDGACVIQVTERAGNLIYPGEQ